MAAGVAALAAAAVDATATTRGSSDTSAAPEGQAVVEILTSDHREVQALVAQIWETPDDTSRRDLANTVTAELVRHAVAEEEHVYPSMKKHVQNGEEAVQHDLEEHRQLEGTLKELEGVDGDDPRFIDRCTGCRRCALTTSPTTRPSTFPELRATLPRTELVALAGKVESARKLAQTRPYPSTPDRRDVPQAGRTGCRDGGPTV